jgi:hypothetical protein
MHVGRSQATVAAAVAAVCLTLFAGAGAAADGSYHQQAFVVSES